MDLRYFYRAKKELHWNVQVVTAPPPCNLNARATLDFSKILVRWHEITLSWIRHGSLNSYKKDFAYLQGTVKPAASEGLLYIHNMVTSIMLPKPYYLLYSHHMVVQTFSSLTATTHPRKPRISSVKLPVSLKPWAHEAAAGLAGIHLRPQGSSLFLGCCC